MKRFSVFSLSAKMLGLALLPGNIVAQQKSLKSNLSVLGRLYLATERPPRAQSSLIVSTPTAFLSLMLVVDTPT
jgi:hypothetical protein